MMTVFCLLIRVHSDAGYYLFFHFVTSPRVLSVLKHVRSDYLISVRCYFILHFYFLKIFSSVLQHCFFWYVVYKHFSLLYFSHNKDAERSTFSLVC